MTNTLKLVLATVVGVTLTIGSLSATETVEKVDAFKNISTQAVSVEESNLLAGKLTRKEFRKLRDEHCKTNASDKSCKKFLGAYTTDLYNL